MTNIALLLALAAAPGFAAPFVPGRNSVSLRGKAQDIYFLPAGPSARGSVLFTPGDGGWRGAAIDMAKQIAQAGFDVYGWDVKKYLKGFTTDTSTLSADEVRSDVLSLLGQLGNHVILAGWSQGAAMSVLAAAGSAPDVVRGVLAIGLPASGVLGWRWKDDLTYVTRQEPDEPKFRTAAYVPLLNSVPFCLIQADMDEYTPSATSDSLYTSVPSPKQRFTITGSQHNFSGHEREFYARLREGLEWLVSRTRTALR